jgi:hypothetical protein
MISIGTVFRPFLRFEFGIVSLSLQNFILRKISSCSCIAKWDFETGLENIDVGTDGNPVH